MRYVAAVKYMVLEAVASARSQPVASLVTILVIAGMILTVMMTTGRTVAAEQKVLSSIDDAGTRAIEVRASDDAGMTTDVLTRLRSIEGVEWAAAFSSAVDATNTLIPDGTRVPVRYVYGDRLDQLGIPSVSNKHAAYASQDALDLLGLVDIGGAITLTSGTSAEVSGRIRVPDYLRRFEPLVLIPAVNEGPATVNVLLVIAETPELVSPLTDTLTTILAANDPSKVSVQTSEVLADLRGLVQSQLSSSSRALVLALLGITAVLVGGILYGLIMMRRKDFGRRRALGATRGYIVTLLMTQTGILALTGIAFGLIGATATALFAGDTMPDLTFIVSLAVLALSAALLAALVPAIAASRREPIRELRVP